MTFADMWAWLSATVPAPTLPVAVVGLLLGSAVVVTPAAWRATRLFATYIHELGHAVFAVASGRRVTSIRLEADTSGSTEHVGPKSGIGRLLTAFAGYPGPALAGWALVLLTAAGSQRWALGLIGAVVVVFALVQRSLRGWGLTILVVLACFVLASLPSAFAALALFAVAGYLLLASPRTIVELHRQRRTGRTQHSDADALHSLTGIAPVFWEVLFLAVCTAAIWSGGARVMELPVG
jgi:hypothetical protein